MKTNNEQAEIKIRKFGELLTDNADGNPEPSPEDREGVETRHGLCEKCGEPIPIGKYKSAKYCSKRCRVAAGSYKYRVKKGLIQKPGVGSGGNQLGEDNHMYKTGIGSFRKRALDFYGEKCNRCGSTLNICVHHRNEDRTNNKIENLEVLCKSCHQNHHCIRNLQGRYEPHIKG